ncbi:HlyD family efflux transporter periplasmic adaptor subunit [Rhodanobacter sp. AS-Z3]|uniref:HlyD family secretion protein n=1 Tax=Rhodanobacter sp. AS-Z3 TaxID=3031330 RepID=UPI002479F262|nr:HlyD family efflux transporter periplasmic adaptor subunit [Rhodanobacter sp. AS-Z3]WEN14745.1 HlyD family efflux transporter periplasmic adaptor subunit [Rhodanobacter sp. AS-Z3]
MSQGLFRQEVIDAKRGEWLGSIIVVAPLSRWLLTALALALAATILLLLFLGHYTRRETVTGQLVPDAGLLTLSAQTTGTVTRTLVHEGEQVTARQPLAEISAGLDSSMGDTHEVVDRQLRVQEAEARIALANLQPQTDAQAKDLRSRIDMLRSQIDQIGGQLVLERRQADTDANLLKEILPLKARGQISTVQFDQYQATALSEQSQVKAVMSQRLTIQQQLSSLRAQLTQLPLSTATQASQLRGQLAQLDARLAENAAARGTVLRAPQAGIVSALLVKQGQHVTNDQQLLSILPEGAKLEAQLLVSSSAIGFIDPGNRVVLRYEAYSYKKFGQQSGKVEQVSRSALTSAEASLLLGRSATVPLYRVLVSLDHQTIDAYGKAKVLKPGMALSADILLDRRSLWQWVFEPLYGLRQQLSVHGVPHE